MMGAAAGTAVYPLPPPETIRRTAEEVVNRPAYDLESGGGGDMSFLLALIEKVFDLLGRILAPVGQFFEAVFDLSPILGWFLIITLLAILVALIAHIVYTFASALRGRRAPGVLLEPEATREQLPETWERRAQESLARGDFLTAVRCLFRACLLRLEAARKRAVQRAATNREYLRRFRDTAAFEPLHRFVDVIDTKWYRGEPCSPGDYEQCAQAHTRIRRIAEEMADAHRA